MATRGFLKQVTALVLKAHGTFTGIAKVLTMNSSGWTPNQKIDAGSRNWFDPRTVEHAFFVGTTIELLRYEYGDLCGTKRSQRNLVSHSATKRPIGIT